MKQKILFAGLLTAFVSVFNFSCKKDSINSPGQIGVDAVLSNTQLNATSNYNLEVVLRGTRNQNGHIHFRQDENTPHIISLETKVHNLNPNHEYKLQRAVDVNIDGNCTGTNWLTLGKGLVPQSIYTDNKGDGSENLWRNISMIPSGSLFDIHFRVIDAVTLEAVLTSNCYQYTVR